jgi:hypothetical protein
MPGAVLLVLATAGVGLGLTAWVGLPLRFEERVAISVVVGHLAVVAAAFVGFEAFGFGTASLAVAIGLPLVPASVGLFRQGPAIALEARDAWRRLRLPIRRTASLRPLLLLTLACGAVTTRVLSLAYQTTDRGISVGNLAVWGDWSAHAAYSGSFVHGGNRGLDLPLATGHPLRYHFLPNFAGSTYSMVGLDVPRGLVWSVWPIAVVLPVLLYAFVRHLARDRGTALLATVLFLLTGGIGAWYFLRAVGDEGWGLLTRLPETYARMPAQELWMDNTISASLYAQRSTLYGLATGLAAAILLLVARPGWQRRGFLVAGVLLGTTGISHVHTLATGLALGGLCLLFDRRRTWLWFLVPAAVVGLPLAAAISPPTNAMRWLPGWLAAEADQSWILFWLRNLGLFLPLFLGIALLGGVLPRLRRLSAPLWLWFAAANLVAFHPSPTNNTKYFLFWQLAGCIVIADLLRRLVSGPARGWPAPARAGARGLAAVVVVALTSAGALDAVRSIQRSSAIPWVDHDEVAAAVWLRDQAEPDDVLVYGASNTSAVAALSGVGTVSAYPGWTYDLGLPDAFERYDASRRMLQGARGAEDDLARYSVDYVAIGPRERSEHGASDRWWDDHGRLLFQQGEYRIYGVGPPR